MTYMILATRKESYIKTSPETNDNFCLQKKQTLWCV